MAPAEKITAPIELVVWRDIASHKGANWSDTPTSGGTWLMYTAGWVTDETDIDLTIHSTIGDPTREMTFAHDTVIPKGCIVKRTVIRKQLPRVKG
jgi:hypothetical protein